MKDVKKQILRTLKEIGKKNNIKILWAIESGSRAWGFSSEDSDYDVRCMHIGKTDDYLGLNPPPKQINFSKDELDIESWDIQKFVELSLKSNPQIAEWLRSPIVYIDSDIRTKFKNYFDKGCSLEFLGQHYLRMAKQNYHKYMGSGASHSCKKYLYVLRGIACSNFIKEEKKLPPLPYKDVIPYLPDFAKEFFERCVIQKNMTEKAEIISDQQVSHFIESSFKRIDRNANMKFSKEAELNAYLIKIIKSRGNKR